MWCGAVVKGGMEWIEESDIADRRWILGAEVFVVGRRKRSRVVSLQCNAVRSVHKDGWQGEAARAVMSDVTGRLWVSAVTGNAKRV